MFRNVRIVIILFYTSCLAILNVFVHRLLSSSLPRLFRFKTTLVSTRPRLYMVIGKFVYSIVPSSSWSLQMRTLYFTIKLNAISDCMVVWLMHWDAAWKIKLHLLVARVVDVTVISVGLALPLLLQALSLSSLWAHNRKPSAAREAHS